MTIRLITFGIIMLTLLSVSAMLYRLRQQKPISLSFFMYCKLVISGIIAFMADTLGLGSFVMNVAMAKSLGTFSDDELPGVNNGAQVIPGTIESLFFIQLAEVDLITLVTLVAGTCLGGVLGGAVVSRMSKQAIRLSMIICFLLMIGLLICHRWRLLPTDGDLIELRSWSLLFGFLALVVCGILTSLGLGLFAMVQGVLFLMGVSPLVAFPIMTTAGAMQQPLTSLVFMQQDKIPIKKTLIYSLAGCIGVAITLPLFGNIKVTWLPTLLLGILLYNVLAIGHTFLRARRDQGFRSQNESLTVYNP